MKPAVFASLLVLALVALLTPTSNAFVVPSTSTRSSTTKAFLMNRNKPKEDLSYIESRDMTREEMMALNKASEDRNNMELSMMTGFSLILSLPMLYLCWVAFFSD